MEKHDKYLGIRTLVVRSREVCFNPLKDQIWKKIQVWREKVLSFAGKGVILKVIAQAVPIYMMSCFQIPQSTCDEINQIMPRY